jgi:thioredoxin 1
VVLDKLKDKPDYAAVTVFLVDFDNDAAALKAFGVNQQSTLIAFKGVTETGRSAGATKADAIEALLISATK